MPIHSVSGRRLLQCGRRCGAWLNEPGLSPKISVVRLRLAVVRVVLMKKDLSSLRSKALPLVSNSCTLSTSAKRMQRTLDLSMASVTRLKKPFRRRDSEPSMSSRLNLFTNASAGAVVRTSQTAGPRALPRQDYS